MRRARTSELSITPSTVSATFLMAGMASASAVSVSWFTLSRKICIPVFFFFFLQGGRGGGVVVDGCWWLGGQR